MTRAPACPKTSKSMSRSSRGLNQRACSRCIRRRSGGGEEELQDAFDACTPALLVVLAALRFEIRERVTDHPSLGDQGVAERARIDECIDALCRPRVEPDPQRKWPGQRLHLAENDTIVPPDGRGEDREPTEGGGVAEPEVHREQAAERRAAHR